MFPNIIPFGEYRPDVSDYEGQHTRNILNVVPQGDGYGPFKDLTAYTSALGAACRGYFYALKNDGSIAVFAGTSTKLYLLNNTDNTWTDVSKSASTYTTLPTDANWQFVQFNAFVIAVQQNANPQVFTLSSSTAFDDLGGSPPQASYVAVVNRFVVLTGIKSANVYRVQWSGLNDVTNWTSGVNDSDYQDLADGGIVRGVAGGEYGIIFQDRSIRRMTFQPGSDIVFGIDRISKDDGLLAPYSLVNAGDKIFFYSSQGFKKIESGSEPQPIGKEKVDRTFGLDLDFGNLQLCIGTADPQKQRVYWFYKSVNGSAGVFDKVLTYDWVLDRWAALEIMGEYAAPLSRPGMTLEQVDAAYDTASPVSLTSVTTSTSAVIFGLAAHGLTAGQGIIFPNAIVGLTANTPYYVLAASLDSSSFRVSSTGGVGALAGTAVGTTSTATSTTFSATFIQSSIDTLSIGSLDSISIANEPALSAVDTSHKIGFFTGTNLEATLESAEHGDGQQRIYVDGYKPVCDAANIFGSVSKRENMQAATTYSSEEAVDIIGNVNARVSTRYARAKIRVTAGTTWTFAAGIIPDTSLEGQR